MKKISQKHSLSEGFSSIEFLTVLLFLSVSAVAVLSIVRIYQNTLKRSLSETEIRTLISSIADTVLSDLKADSTPQSDSKQDIFWSWNGKQTEGVSISIRCLSASLNPNFVRVSLCEKTDIASLFLTEKSASMLQQHREDSGILFLYENFKSFFSEETYEKYFSVYGWANINLSDEFALRNLVSARTSSDTDGEFFRQKLRTLLTQNQLVQSNTDFKLFSGTLYDAIYPYIMAEPVMNIHYVEPLILESIISYPEYSIVAPKAKVSQLLSLRETREVTQNDIENILEITKSNRLYYYFGTVTWFWQITLEHERERCDIIVCRVPSDDTTVLTKPDWYVIERRWK